MTKHLWAWRWLFAALGLMLFVAGFYLEQNWQGARAWTRYQAKLAAAREPVDFTGVVPPSAGDPENLARTPFLAAIFPAMTGGPGPRDPGAMARVRGFATNFDAASSLVRSSGPPRTNSWAQLPPDLPAWYGAFLDATNPPQRRNHGPLLTNFTPREAASGILAALADTDPVIDELRAASRRPYCRFDLDYGNENPTVILLPHLAVLKHLSQILRLRVVAELSQGKPTEAFEDMKLMLRLNDACRTEPFLISQLVRLAQTHLSLGPIAEGLAGHHWTEAQLKTLQEQLQAYDFLADGRRALQSERTFMLRTIDFIHRSPNQSSGVAGASGPGSGAGDTLSTVLTHLAPGGWYDFEKVQAGELLDECLLPMYDLQHRQLSPSAVQQGEARLEGALGHSFPGRILHHRLMASMSLPALSGVSFKVAFAQAGVDATAVAVALERYRLSNGKFPAELQALVPRFLNRLPVDIINGQPLQYRRNEDGSFLLYSVGWNETSEDGTVALKPKVGTADPKEGDWVWRGP